MSNSKQILKDMANLTAFSGKISDVQEKNMRLFPYFYFEGISDDIRVEYNLTHHHDIQEENDKLVINKPITNSHVTYYINIDESKNDNLNLRFLALSKSIKTLFWNDVKVEIYLNGHIKYKG